MAWESWGVSTGPLHTGRVSHPFREEFLLVIRLFVGYEHLGKVLIVVGSFEESVCQADPSNGLEIK